MVPLGNVLFKPISEKPFLSKHELSTEITETHLIVELLILDPDFADLHCLLYANLQ